MTTQGFVDCRGNPIKKERHGGIRAASFINFTVMMRTLASSTMTFNLVTYLHDTMHTGVAKSSTISTNYLAASYGFALLGAFLSDSYITKFNTLLIFGLVSFSGYALLALQAHLPALRPPSCNTSEWIDCEEVRGFNSVLLYIGLCTVGLGEGCTRACLASLGGDQFDVEDPVELQLQSSFFNWYGFGNAVGTLMGLTLIVWLENNVGWDYGFGTCALVVFTGSMLLISGFPFYRNQLPGGSPLTRILQVLVAAFRNRNQNMSDMVVGLLQEEAEEVVIGGEMLSHSKGLSFLDKARIKQGNSSSWSLCTVAQVEETKSIVSMIPIIVTSALSYTPYILLTTLTVQQGNTMNTRVWKFNIPPASLFVVPLVLQIVLLIAYDRVFVPLARRITGYAGGITPLQRIGAGFVFITLSSCIAAVIERERLNNAGVGEKMSILWLGPQFLVLSLTDITSFVGLLEFLSSEAPRGMKSLGAGIFWCIPGLASLMGTFLIDIVNEASRSGGKGTGWMEGATLNQSRLDLFYSLIFGLGVVVFVIYVFFARRYICRVNTRVSFLINSP